MGDGDSGGNGLLNFPVIAVATTSGPTTTVVGTLNSLPGTTFTLAFYSSSAADPSGFGEGETLLSEEEQSVVLAAVESVEEDEAPRGSGAEEDAEEDTPLAAESRCCVCCCSEDVPSASSISSSRLSSRSALKRSTRDACKV